MPGHGGLAEGRVILGNAGKLPLDHPHCRAGAAAFQALPRIAGRNGGNVTAGHKLHPVTVVIAQNLQGVFALLGAGYGTPLLHTRAGHRAPVAVFGVVRLAVAAAPDIGGKQLGGQALHDRKNGAPRHIRLIDPRRAGDIKGIAPAGVPFAPDAVERQADLG